MSERIPILISYAYIKPSLVDLLERHYDKFDIILDSGAFTAFNTGRTIELKDYMYFIEKSTLDFEFYFTLDVIGNPSLTNKNYIEMKMAGLDPVPVFTRGQSTEEYNTLYKDQGFIGIGGIAGTPDCQWHLRNLYNTGTIRDCDKVHWLGFWDRNFVLYFKPFSCDTQGWMSAARYGRGWVLRHRKLYSFDRKSYNSPEVKSFCRKYGIDNNKLRLDSAWRWNKKEAGLSQYIQCIAAIAYAKMIREKIGSIIYLACSGNQCNLEVQLILDCLKYFD